MPSADPLAIGTRRVPHTRVDAITRRIGPGTGGPCLSHRRTHRFHVERTASRSRSRTRSAPLRAPLTYRLAFPSRAPCHTAPHSPAAPHRALVRHHPELRAVRNPRGPCGERPGPPMSSHTPCRLTHRAVSHTVPSRAPCRRASLRRLEPRCRRLACPAWYRRRATPRTVSCHPTLHPPCPITLSRCARLARSVSPIRPLAPPRLRVLQRQDMRTGAHVLRFTWNGDGPAPADTPCATAINPPSGPRRPVRHTSRAARSSPRSSPRSRRVVGVAVSRGTGTSAQPASTLEHARPSPCRPDGAHETQGAANRGSTCSKASRGRQLRPHHRWSPTPAAKRRHG
jgi:hypothetical protein